ncbi:ABC transporter permease [Gorillibacterium sp. CAU 1737]|uniref:ABC transporter permease n=1 Tax=Gorillibacterium sp. CAU 1737 TaxID=3140362 RepID=UPI0032617011
MYNLVRNENMKIYNRVRTWVLVGLLVLASILFTIAFYAVNDYSSSGDWRERTQKDIETYHQTMASTSGMVEDQVSRMIKISEYRLEHDIPPQNNSIWGGTIAGSGLVFLVSIFTVIIAADIVAGEFAAGTIKLLLIRPASRAKVLLSKYLATLQFSLLLLVVLFLVSFVASGLLFGFKGVGSPYLYLGGDGFVHERSMIQHAFSTYGLKCVNLIMIVTMAFMISSVFRSSALSIALSIVALLMGDLLVVLLGKYEWMRFYLFSNTDLTQYLEGVPPFEGMTMGFSICVLIGYFLLFNGLSWLLFTKRDVRS